MWVSPWKRRVIVNRFQYRLLAGSFLYLASIVLVFFVVLFAPVVAILADGSVPQAQREIAAHQFLVLHERVWFALPALVALCIFHSVVVSHRIAGPLHRFKQVFARLADGDLSVHVAIRRNDYLRQEAEIMAEMVRSLRVRVRAIQDGHRQASMTLPQLMDALGRGASEDSAVLAGKLGTQLDALGEQVRQFSVPIDDRAAALPERTASSRNGVPTT
jgi:methyl-accepting chemotaxis protein